VSDEPSPEPGTTRAQLADSASESKRRILRTSSIIGGTSLTGVILSLVRMKFAALTVGPAGVGMIGLFQNVVALATSLGGLGVSNSAPREVAIERSRRGQEGAAAVGRVVILASAALALVSGLLFFIFRRAIAEHALGDARLAGDVGWLALAVAAGVMLASETTLLTAFGRIGDAGRASVFGALLTTIFAVPIFLFAGDIAPLLFVISSGLIGCAVALHYTAKLPSGRSSPLELAVLKPLIQLGIAISASTMISLVSLLLVRRMVADHLGLAGLGSFQASWALASMYLLLVLQAMSADFYPRLSEASADHEAFGRLINEQTEIALLLGGPMILAALGAAPLVILVFYGESFGNAASMFSWQLGGDVLRIASWPFSFAILAQNKRGSYFFCEVIAWTLFAVVSALLLDQMGLAGVGAAYAVMYLVYLPVTWIVLRLHVPLRWSRRVTADFWALLTATAFLSGVAAYNQRMGLGVGFILSAAFAYQAFRRLKSLVPRLFRL
jgi:O-antigen/teichoic acid export membrane protein